MRMTIMPHYGDIPLFLVNALFPYSIAVSSNELGMHAGDISTSFCIHKQQPRLFSFNFLFPPPPPPLTPADFLFVFNVSHSSSTVSFSWVRTTFLFVFRYLNFLFTGAFGAQPTLQQEKVIKLQTATTPKCFHPPSRPQLYLE